MRACSTGWAPCWLAPWRHGLCPESRLLTAGVVKLLLETSRVKRVPLAAKVPSRGVVGRGYPSADMCPFANASIVTIRMFGLASPAAAKPGETARGSLRRMPCSSAQAPRGMPIKEKAIATGRAVCPKSGLQSAAAAAAHRVRPTTARCGRANGKRGRSPSRAANTNPPISTAVAARRPSRMPGKALTNPTRTSAAAPAIGTCCNHAVP